MKGKGLVTSQYLSEILSDLAIALPMKIGHLFSLLFFCDCVFATGCDSP